MTKPLVKINVYLEWQCEKCHAMNYSPPHRVEFTRTAEMEVEPPVDVTCKECGEVHWTGYVPF